MRYINFDLEAFDYTNAAGSEHFYVRISRSPAGEQKINQAEPVAIPGGLRDLIDLFNQRNIPIEKLIEIGENLASLLFAGNIRSFFERSLERLGDDEGLRLRLKFDTVALADLPWEYLYLSKPDTPVGQKDADGFLCLNRKISIVRYEVIGESLTPLTAVPGGRLRMLAVLASPNTPDLAPLNIELERRDIESALGETPEIEVEFFEQATVQSLEDALVKDAQIFHFAGHGTFETELGDSLGSLEGKGSIFLVGEAGGEQKFASEKLAQNLRGRGVRLAVLGACEGGRRDQVNAWTGVAAALVRAGIPAVVGMQFSILDQNAISFSQRFYRALSAGQPVDAAVSDGRLSIYNRKGLADRDWGVPVLYMRDEEGVLFPEPTVLSLDAKDAFKAALRPGKAGWIVLLATTFALLLSLLAGANQLVGFFGKISLPTALLSVALAAIVAFAFPTLLRKQFPTGERVLKMPYRTFSILLAVFILLVGLVPFLGKYWAAENARTKSNNFLDANQYAPAKVLAERAGRYFADLGLENRAAASKLILIQVYARTGNREKSETLIAGLESSGRLVQSQQAKLDAIRGSIAYQRGDFEQAERFYQLAHQNVAPGSKDEAILLENEAALWVQKGGLYQERASKNLDQAMRIYQALGDQIGEAGVLINQATLTMTEPEKARQLLKQALALVQSQKSSYPYLEGSIYTDIGLTYRKQSNLDKAEENYKLALEKFDQAADPLSKTHVLVNQATVDWERGKKELAKQNLQAAESYLSNIDLTGELTNPRKVAQIRTFQGDLFDSLGESGTSESFYQQALAIYAKHPDPLLELNTQINYAALLIRLGRAEEANRLLKQALELTESFMTQKDTEQFGVLYTNLGKAAQDIGDIDAASAYYKKAEEIFVKTEDRLNQAAVIENEAVIEGYQGKLAEALADFQEAGEIYRSIPNMDHLVQNLYNQYNISASLNDTTWKDILKEIFTILRDENIDQTVEASILLNIYPQDLSDRADLVIFRERMLDLRDFYEKRQEDGSLAQCLVKLADIEQKLGNYQGMLGYAKEAEPYLEQIPTAQQKLTALTNMAWYFLIGNETEKGLDYFYAAYDQAEAVSQPQQLQIAQSILQVLGSGVEDIDRQKYIDRSQAIIAASQDPMIKAAFEQIVEVLK